MNNTCASPCQGGRGQQGFTLVELMIVVVIVGILAMVAVPSYRQYVAKANRAAAESFMMSVANKQEQYLLDARQYATALAVIASAPADVASNYGVVITNPGGATTTYTITATPTGGQAANDAHCGNLILDHTGAKSTSTGATDCW
jgi:type IV pilus assembly protein PilE